MVELPDIHYCDRCYFCGKGINPCNNCEYDEIRGFSKWMSKMGFNGMTDNDLPKKTIEIKKYDEVSKPKHYMLMDNVEVRDVLAALVAKFNKDNTPNSALFVSDYVQMMQYLMRFMEKNGKQDLEKARWYLDKLINPYG